MQVREETSWLETSHTSIEEATANGGGLLIHSALFVLTPFHLYSITYGALICAQAPSFAV